VAETVQAPPPGTVLLHLEDVVAGYGSGDILKGVTLDVLGGGVTCLIGPNGAGKSTVLKAVSGLLRPSAGRVVFQGDDITGSPPRANLLRGIVHVPQERSLFPGMTVWDNLLMAGYLRGNERELTRRVDEVAAMFPIVAERRGAHAGSLSGGEQKQVELARTLLFDPRLILLDEPSIGLDPKSRHLVFDAIGRLAATGRTVLLVEQNARSGLAASHHGAVLEAGVVALTGTGRELLADPEVARLYLGAAKPAAGTTSQTTTSQTTTSQTTTTQTTTTQIDSTQTTAAKATATAAQTTAAQTGGAQTDKETDEQH
jgi:branched-chain amino acid transport system ATP-binding protein